jgi:spore maturation protein CgeB
MREHLRRIIEDRDAARALANHGLRTIHARHTCAHRVDELLNIHASLEADTPCHRA